MKRNYYFKKLGKGNKIKGKLKYSKKHIDKVDDILYYSEPIVVKKHSLAPLLHEQIR